MNSRSLLATLLLTILSLAFAGSAVAAKPGPAKPPVKVAIGKVWVAAGIGRPTLLVPVRYPIQLAGRVVETRVALLDSAGGAVHSRALRTRLSSGEIRRPDRRRSFTFVHRVALDEGLRQVLREGSVQVAAQGRLDLDGDGRVELRSSDRAAHAPTFGRRPKALCSSVPHLRVQPGKRVAVPLPACDRPLRWTVAGDRARGTSRIRHGRVIYRAPQRFRGRVAILLAGKRLGRGAGFSAVAGFVPGPVQVTVGAAPGVVVRALGDSVTAGFGYFSSGEEMAFGQLFECRPAAKEFDDACSSNSLNRTSKEAKVKYATDYGLANNVSWAAQWANSHGITNFKNFAVSGSEPKNWAPGGELHSTTAQIAAEDPDYILMTMGANPLLSEMLFGIDNMGCAVESDVFGNYQRCVEESFTEVGLQEHLKALYSDLVENTDATVFLMQYHLSIPSTALAYSATQIAAMGQLLNREIAAIAAAVNPQRLRVVTPPHFDVGIDISPVYLSRYSCSLLDFEVDGPSVQSTPTQVELDVLHPLSFCPGPAGGGDPWVISGDTGIHPSAAGYEQMASQVPAPS